MIRFTCPHCGRYVRVSDAHGGKKGQCPYCHQIVAIPTASEAGPEPGGDEVAELAAVAAASDADEAEETPPPPPPHHTEDVPTEEEPEPELLPPTDPRYQTDKLDAVTDTEGPPEQAETPPPGPGAVAPSAAPATAARGKRGALFWGLVIGGGLLALGVVAMGVVFVAVLLQGAGIEAEGGQPGPATAATSVVERPGPERTPQPTPQPAEAKTSLPLSAAILNATAHAPADAFCMFYVDLARTAKAVAKIPPRAEEVAAAIGTSKLWQEADKRVEEGSMPSSVTLFLTRQSEPAGELFEKLYGVISDGTIDPAEGLWGLTDAKHPLPHFLLRMTGPATKHYSAELLATARKFYPNLPPASDKVVTCAGLRLSPAGLAGPEELLLGTKETLAPEGAARKNVEQQQRLRELLKKVETDRPVVGWVVLAGLGKALESALGRAERPVPWVTSKTNLLFALDPKPDGLATIVLADPAPGSMRLLKAEVQPMAVEADGPDLRITGLSSEGLPVLAKLMPGFQDVVLPGLAMAQPIESRLAKAQPPQPQPQPSPQPTPQPKTQPRPAPGPKVTLKCICFNPNCTTKHKPFDVDKSKIPAEVLAGNAPLVCPHCHQPTAVVAVKCPHCGKYTPQTLPNCEHCGKPLR